MRRRGPDDGVVRVELLDGDEPQGPGGGTPTPPRGDRSRTRLLRLAGVLALLAVAGVIVGADALERRREAALRLALSDVPGFMDPFDGPIAEVWRAPGEWPIIETDQVMVLQSEDGTRMTAIDVQSGAVIWSRGVPPGASCVPFGDDSAQVPPTLWDRIACARTRGMADQDGPGAGSLLVLDAAEGTVVLSRPLEESVLFVQPIEDDLIIVAEDQESRLEVRRWLPEADRDLWVFRSEPGLRDALVSDVDGWWGWWIEDGVFLIESDSESLALDVATGEVVAPPDPVERGLPVSTRELPDGGTVVGTHPLAVPSSTRVLNADGSLRYELGATPWMPWVTDGSVAGIVAVRDEETREVIGLDAATGELVWSAGRLAGVEPTLQVDGVLVAQGAHTAVGIDMATGSTLWTADAAAAEWWPALTDGEVVLLFTRNDGADHLAAHDLRSGAIAWRVPAPEGTRYARALGRTTVLVYTDTEIVAYR